MHVTPDDLRSLSPEDFEKLIAQLLAASGFRNIVSLAGGDEGIDLRAEWFQESSTGGARMTVWPIQRKRYSKSLTQHQVREIVGAALEPPLDLLPARQDSS